MGIQESFSRLKKKVKRLGRKKPNRTEPDVVEENVDPANPLPPPEPHLMAGDGEGNTDGQQTCSADRPPRPDELKLAPASGSGNGQGEGEAGVDGGEVGWRHSQLHSDVETEVGSGSNRGGSGGTDGEEDEKFYSCSSTPSIPCSGEPNGA